MKNNHQNRIHLNSNRDNRNIYTISIPNDSEPYTDAQIHGSHGFSIADQHHNYTSHWTKSDHEQDPNASLSHHSHSHETHCTSSHSTHVDTHTSSHDTNAATDYGSCDSGGADAGNCDSGACGGDN